MPWYAIVALALSSITTLGLLAGVFWANARNRYASKTAENYDEAVKSYEDVVKSQNAKIELQDQEIKRLQTGHSQNMREIGRLQGELKSYKELPLKEISQNLKTVTELNLMIASHLKIDGLDKIKVADKNK